MNKETPTLTRTKGLQTQYWIYRKSEYTPVDEKFLRTKIQNFSKLNRKARKKAYRDFVKSCYVAATIHAPTHLPNTKRKLRLKGRKHKVPKQEDFTIGARSFLAFTALFSTIQPNYYLAADMLCGMHSSSLQEVEPQFYPALSIRSDSVELLGLFTTLVQAVVPRRKWKAKRWSVNRKSILDYRAPLGELPRHVQDFSDLTLKVRGQKPLKLPMKYIDTIVLMIGADKAQVSEAAPHVESAALLLFNSAPGDFLPTKLSNSDLAEYDPSIARRVQDEAPYIAALLRWWWGQALEDEETWARQIVQEARASFGRPDSRYVHVELDPKRLRDAIRYRVFLSFLDALEIADFMTKDELTPYRHGAKEVFDPAPPEPVAVRHAEDPGIFLEIMRELVQNNPDRIVTDNQRYTKADKPLAAWRMIGRPTKERYLIVLEDVWKTLYKKAARSRKCVDCSFFQHDSWAVDMQKRLADEGLIKQSSSGFRYRYDLLENGSRDSTYVLAIPAHVLES